MLSHVPSMDAAYLTIFFSILIFFRKMTNWRNSKKRLGRDFRKELFALALQNLQLDWTVGMMGNIVIFETEHPSLSM
jgi:hypothetical protein